MISYEELRRKLFIEFKEDFNHKEIDNILDISENFDRDSPESLGKRILITRLKFNGTKNTGDIIRFDRMFYSGVNVIFTDGNGRGKSSIFKIIKLLLTGSKNGLKDDVIKWIDKVYLEFKIGTSTYTSIMNFKYIKKLSVNAIVYNTPLDFIISNSRIDSIHKIFEVNSLEKYKNYIQKFFYNQFSYYSLSWTSSTKQDLNLKKNNTSWKTYYKSIYLESKNYNVLFLNESYGKQDKKIFEMLLGLNLTSAINKLEIKEDYIKREIQKIEDENISDMYDFNEDKIQEKIKNLKFQIDNISRNIKDNLYHKKNQYFEIIEELLKKEKYTKELETEIQYINENLSKDIKYLNNLKEEFEFGIFFGDLDIEICPRCEKKFDKSKRELEKKTNRCMICDRELDNDLRMNEELYRDKLKYLKGKMNELEQILSTKSNILEMERKKLSKLKQYEKEIVNKIKLEDNNYIENIQKLIRDKIELEILLNKFGYDLNSKNKIIKESKIIESALENLKYERRKNSEDIFKKLGNLILKTINKFGLTNITKVYFDNNLNLNLIQNNTRIKFEDLNEGEKLRAKIAFYISLISLDIVYSFGRHPRLLFIDSPGKEEVISKDLQELSCIFFSIENEMKDNLQIFIGTTLEEFKNATVKEKLITRENEEYMF